RAGGARRPRRAPRPRGPRGSCAHGELVLRRGWGLAGGAGEGPGSRVGHRRPIVRARPTADTAARIAYTVASPAASASAPPPAEPISCDPAQTTLMIAKA